MGGLCSSANGGASDVPNAPGKAVKKELGEERKKELMIAFKTIDKNGDGHLTRAEMIRASRSSPEIAKILNLPTTIGDDQRAVFEKVF